MKAQAENELQSSQTNLEQIIAHIDEAVDFHTQNLQKRANWLKSHAEHIHALTQDSFCEQLNQLNETSSDLLKCVEDAESVTNGKEKFLETLETCFSKLNICQSQEKTTLTFEADNTGLSEAILAFGKISTIKDDMESNESFVFADDDRDGIEIVTKEERNNVVEWLRKKTPTIEQYSFDAIDSDDNELRSWLGKNKCLEKTKDERISSPWIFRKNNHSDSGRSSPNESTNADDDYTCYLLRSVKIEERSSATSLFDLNSTFLHPSRRESQQYEYPKRKFLDHCDFLDNQDMRSYLVEKKDENVESRKLDDETCQWLYRKDKCEKDKCSADGCDLFNKNWLRTVNDW